MPLVSEVVFSTAIISWIESIGGGRVGRGWDGWLGQVGNCRWGKPNILTQRAVLCHQ